MKQILITSGGGLQGLSLLKQAASLNYTTHVFDINQESIGRYFSDYYIAPPLYKSASFTKFLVRYCVKNNIDLVLPSSDHDLEKLSEAKKQLAREKIKVAVCDQPLLGILLDKLRLYGYLKKHKIAVLPFCIATSNDALPFPLLCKPRRGWGGRQISILRNIHELNVFLKTSSPEDFLFQKLMKQFREFSVDFALNDHGEATPPIIRERLYITGGLAAVAQLVTENNVFKIVHKLTSLLYAIGGYGIFNVQFVQYEGKFYLNDINPRIGTSAVFNEFVGINFIEFLLNGKHPLPTVYRTTQKMRDVKCVRYLAEKIVPVIDPRQYKAVIFDLDGTLFDHKRWMLSQAERFSQAAFSGRLRKQILLESMTIIEDGRKDALFDLLAQKHGWDLQTKKAYLDLFRRSIPTGNYWYADGIKLILSLKNRGYRVGIVTDSSKQSQTSKLNSYPYKLFRDINAIVYTPDLRLQKPQKECFQRICAALKIAPAQSIMVGDHIIRDISGALRTGFRLCFLVNRPGGFHHCSEYSSRYFNHENIIAVKDLSEVKTILCERPF